jgi:hypothetical protein
MIVAIIEKKTIRNCYNFDQANEIYKYQKLIYYYAI